MPPKKRTSAPPPPRVPPPPKPKSQQHAQKGKSLTSATQSIANIAPACTTNVTNMQRILPSGTRYMQSPASSSKMGSMFGQLSPSTQSSIQSHIVDFGSFSKDATFPSHLQGFQPPLQIGYGKKKATPSGDKRRSKK